MYKALISAGQKLPTKGGVYMTVSDADKPAILPIAKELAEMGFKIYATKGTSTFLQEQRSGHDHRLQDQGERGPGRARPDEARARSI